ncbi:hypothetical protein PCANC_21852 [Puccinia coronata f. sp. avenae]|uniref:Uncharacterized protein n=1 Tax=Puccinia coronata f. sp. avenae TaxID=200324 RepID=A0A2N5SDN3_9BASI|nr:hypothetical protein PCANC_21852 [Puccinia coronata f. sp. avenae]PLW32692.1 hypothetical protein PCASD_16833 [Puccinia coronata f. sp. avenae]
MKADSRPVWLHNGALGQVNSSQMMAGHPLSSGPAHHLSPVLSFSGPVSLRRRDTTSPCTWDIYSDGCSSA